MDGEVMFCVNLSWPKMVKPSCDAVIEAAMIWGGKLLRTTGKPLTREQTGAATPLMVLLQRSSPSDWTAPDSGSSRNSSSTVAISATPSAPKATPTGELAQAVSVMAPEPRLTIETAPEGQPPAGAGLRTNPGSPPKWVTASSAPSCEIAMAP